MRVPVIVARVAFKTPGGDGSLSWQEFRTRYRPAARDWIRLKFLTVPSARQWELRHPEGGLIAAGNSIDFPELEP